MQFQHIYLSIFLILIFTSCKTGPPAQPSNVYFNNPAETVSKINIPVSIDLKTLEFTINNQIDSVLYEDKNLDEEEKSNLKMRAVKSSDITLEVNQQTIRYVVPVDLWIEKAIAFTSFEAAGEISLIFETNFIIVETWNLETTTKLINHEWIRKPVLKLGLFDLPVKFFCR